MKGRRLTQMAGAARRRVGSGLARLGFDRSWVVRRFVRIGHPRLREFELRVRTSPLLQAAVEPGRRWLNAKPIQIPAGLAHGMWISKSDLPLTHAHLGSVAFGNLEASVQEALLRHLGPGDVFYDIGANLGFFALLGARLVGPEGRVFAFEPAPANAGAIVRNAALNGFENVEVIEKAVSARGGQGRLQIVDDQSWSKLTEYGEHPGTEEVVTVELTSVDELVGAGKAPPPRAVKIDVEGAEIAVLEGMRRTLAEHRPAVICELHDTHAEFVAAMTSCGYRTINLEGTAPVTQTGASAHVLALPLLHPGD